MVIAEPLPVLVQRHDEQVVPLQHGQDLRGVGHPADRRAERGAEPAQHRRADQELLDFRRLPGEHLFGQEVTDEPVVPGELADELVRRRMTAQRQRGQVHAGRPAFRPRHQIRQIRTIQLNARYRVHQHRHVRGGQAQLVGPDIEQLAGRAQAAQPQRRIGPGGQHQLDRRRQVREQEVQLLVAGPLGDDVVVVEHQDDRCGQRGQRVDQPGQHGDGELGDLYPEGAQDILGAEVGTDPLHGADHVPPQPARVIVGGVQRHPGEWPALRGAGPPLGDQCRFAEARRSVDQHQLHCAVRG